jgi:hypothetical protein
MLPNLLSHLLGPSGELQSVLRMVWYSLQSNQLADARPNGAGLFCIRTPRLAGFLDFALP